MGGAVAGCALARAIEIAVELLLLADARLSAGERRRLNRAADYYLSP